MIWVFTWEENIGLFRQDGKHFVIPAAENTIVNKAIRSSIIFDGEFIYEKKDDQWRLVTDWNASLDAYYAAFDQPLTRLEDGYPTLCANTEKMTDIAEKVYSLYWENAGVLKHDIPGQIFTGGHSLFINGLIGTYTAYTRDVDFSFGLLPYPKWDESQDNYGTHNRNGYSQYGIPKTCINTNAASAVLEYACAESYRTIIPAYVGTNLKIKVCRRSGNRRGSRYHYKQCRR